MVEQPVAKKGAILGCDSVYTLALAYAGTSHNSAICWLLHVAVSDTSDNVCRTAVTSAFLPFENAVQVLRIVQLLSGDYNPHV